MGRLLADAGLIPDLIISSSAVRALLTADLVAEESGCDAQILATRELYMAMPEDYLALLQQAPGAVEIVMVVGHNPGIEDLVEELVGQWERMPTAALAHIELEVDDWSSLVLDGKGNLLDIWYPREL